MTDFKALNLRNWRNLRIFSWRALTNGLRPQIAPTDGFPLKQYGLHRASRAVVAGREPAGLSDTDVATEPTGMYS
ncbi:MAG: hypothetical protein KJO85_04965, partial [Gammaproteobacteria bacterium]|nr:hypothetical protein [Gammaproteobacteria bacterium]